MLGTGRPGSDQVPGHSGVGCEPRAKSRTLLALCKGPCLSQVGVRREFQSAGGRPSSRIWPVCLRAGRNIAGHGSHFIAGSHATWFCGGRRSGGQVWGVLTADGCPRPRDGIMHTLQYQIRTGCPGVACLSQELLRVLVEAYGVGAAGLAVELFRRGGARTRAHRADSRLKTHIRWASGLSKRASPSRAR